MGSLLPGLGVGSGVDSFHGDAVVDGADQPAEVAADAFVLVDVGDAVGRGLGLRCDQGIEFGDWS